MLAEIYRQIVGILGVGMCLAAGLDRWRFFYLNLRRCSGNSQYASRKAILLAKDFDDTTFVLREILTLLRIEILS